MTCRLFGHCADKATNANKRQDRRKGEQTQTASGLWACRDRVVSRQTSARDKGPTGRQVGTNDDCKCARMGARKCNSCWARVPTAASNPKMYTRLHSRAGKGKCNHFTLNRQICRVSASAPGETGLNGKRECISVCLSVMREMSVTN